MGDEVREYIRAAQEAELRGDLAQAVENLRKAATLYRGRGNTARALQMLRHARKLDGTRDDIAEEINRLEWLPDQSIARAMEPSDELKTQLEAMLEPNEDPPPLPGARDKQLFERGPTKADPALNAWCSFCCKPRKEVGELVAGPAGSFICAGCLFEAARLLAVPLSPEATKGPPPVVAAKVPAETEVVAGGAELAVARAAQSARNRRAHTAAPFFGQQPAARAVEQALSRGARVVVIAGPEGSGKSAYLLDLERRGLGTAESVEDAAPVLLIDGFDSLPPSQRDRLGWRLLDEPSLRVVLSVRANAPLEPVTLISDDGPFLLHPTGTILAALGDAIPPRIADLVDLLAVFEPLSDDELRTLGRQLAEKRASDLDLSEELLNRLVELAARSGRGGRELEALIRRIPPGSWSVSAAPAAAPKKRTRAKKAP